jgi:hypothetical protein
MNEFNNAKLAAKKKAGVNIHLYSDDHPETTLSGTGFKDAATALRTVELVKLKPRNRQVWTINAMYNRAKHHPHQTASMREAMSIFNTWLAEYNEQKEHEKTHGAKRERGDAGIENGLEAPPSGQKKQKAPPRAALEQEYNTLFNETLPAVAKAEGWPVHLNHCLMRVALDGYWQCCWYDKLDKKKGALRSMSVPQIENVLMVGKKMAQEGQPYVARLNRQSLAYRGKQGPGSTKSRDGMKPFFGTRGVPADASAAQTGPGVPQQCPSGSPIASPTKGTETVEGGNSSPKEAANPKNPKDAQDSKESKSEGSPSAAGAKSEAGLLQVAVASSGRSACRGCKEKIAKECQRVGVQVWSSGRLLMVWHHPLCFVRGAVRVETVDKGSAARCKSTGVKFAKGDVRGVIQVGSSKIFLASAALKCLLAPVCALPEVRRFLEGDGGDTKQQLGL